MRVFWVRTKSSAASISGLPGLSGRDAVAIRPSGLPVLKKKGSAQAGETARIASDAVNQRKWDDIADLHGET
jgi:hypothetical protein